MVEEKTDGACFLYVEHDARSTFVQRYTVVFLLCVTMNVMSREA